MRSGLTGLLACALAACSPAMDWREVREERAGLVAMFPCRPDRVERSVEIAGRRSAMHLLSCSAEATTFAVGWFELDDPAAVAAGLAALRAAALANFGATVAQAVPWQPTGATPNREAARLTLAGRVPDGAAVQVHAAFFAHGLIACQATVFGVDPGVESVQTFFSGLKVGR
jgi:hypothetical protein